MTPKKVAKIPRKSVAIYQNLGYEDNRGKFHKKKWVANVTNIYNFVSGLLNILFNKDARRKN